MRLCFSIDIDDDGYASGFTLSEINEQPRKNYLRQSGHFSQILPTMCDEAIFVDISELHLFQGLMKKIH